MMDIFWGLGRGQCYCSLCFSLMLSLIYPAFSVRSRFAISLMMDGLESGTIGFVTLCDITGPAASIAFNEMFPVFHISEVSFTLLFVSSSLGWSNGLGCLVTGTSSSMFGLESLVTLTSSSVFGLESLVTLTSSAAFGLEGLATVSSSAAFGLEGLATVTSSAAFGLEGLATVTSSAAFAERKLWSES